MFMRSASQNGQNRNGIYGPSAALEPKMEWNCHGDEESGRHKECANVLKSKGYRQVLAIAIDVFAYKEKGKG